MAYQTVEYINEIHDERFLNTLFTNYLLTTDSKLLVGIIGSIIRTVATFTWNFSDLLIILVQRSD